MLQIRSAIFFGNKLEVLSAQPHFVLTCFSFCQIFRLDVIIRLLLWGNVYTQGRIYEIDRVRACVCARTSDFLYIRERKLESDNQVRS